MGAAEREHLPKIQVGTNASERRDASEEVEGEVAIGAVAIHLYGRDGG